jgi:hypothetical protein
MLLSPMQYPTLLGDKLRQILITNVTLTDVLMYQDTGRQVSTLVYIQIQSENVIELANWTITGVSKFTDNSLVLLKGDSVALYADVPYSQLLMEGFTLSDVYGDTRHSPVYISAG